MFVHSLFVVVVAASVVIVLVVVLSLSFCLLVSFSPLLFFFKDTPQGYVSGLCEGSSCWLLSRREIRRSWLS